MTPDYTALSLLDAATLLDTTARDVDSAFGQLDRTQLNWRRHPATWSVAQCLDHLLNANREMFQAIDDATDPSGRRTVWQRLPVLPGVLGPMMIRSQMPQATRKFTAHGKATPASSALDPAIVERFLAHQRDAAARVRSLDARNAGRIMASPFVSFITYSVLDGCRLIVAHERRHFEQAQRVTLEPGFPRLTSDRP